MNVAIGAVAMYRLAIDPLPVILMDEELMMRSGDFVTRPYSEDFVSKYIGTENIELYKQTDIYQEFKKSIMSHEKQNEAIFNIIHWQIIERSKFEDITKQMHLLSYTDRLAVIIVMSSTKFHKYILKVVSIMFQMSKQCIQIRLLVLRFMKISSLTRSTSVSIYHLKWIVYIQN